MNQRVFSCLTSAYEHPGIPSSEAIDRVFSLLFSPFRVNDVHIKPVKHQLFAEGLRAVFALNDL
jgi:hypothetical protein